MVQTDSHKKLSPQVATQSEDYSTQVYTPSPMTKLKSEYETHCRCGCTQLATFESKFSCKNCGAFALKKIGGLIFVSFILISDLDKGHQQPRMS